MPILPLAVALAVALFLIFRPRARRSSPSGPSASPGTPAATPIPVPSPAPSPPVATAPSIQITAPVGGVHPSPLRVEYLLADTQSDPAKITFRYSKDNGTTFHLATEFTPGSDGVVNLSTSPTGVPHVFLWDASTDLGSSGGSGLLFEATPSDSLVGPRVQTAPFDVRAAVVSPPPTPVATPGTVPMPTPPPIPEIHAFKPVDGIGGLVPVPFLVSHELSQKVQVTVHYSLNGAAFKPATAAPESDRLQDVPASKHTADYRYIWNAIADVGSAVTGTANLRFSVTDGQQTGVPSQTGSFGIDTTPAPPFPANPPDNTLPVLLEILSGNNQKGIAGQVLPEPLVVRVRDANQQPVAGAIIGFSMAAGSPFIAGFEPDETHVEFTALDGQAAVRVRLPQAANGAANIVAALTGVPGLTQAFTVEAYAPLLIPDTNNPTGPLQYGETYGFRIYYDGDGDTTTLDFHPDARRPIRLNLTVTGGEADRRQLVFPELSSLGSNSAYFEITPSAFSGSVAIHIDDPANPTLLPYDLTLPVQTDPAAQRLMAIRPVRLTSPVEMRLAVVSGNDAGNKPQRGFAGVTLATPFQVSLVDGSGLVYDRRITSGFSGCGTVTRDILEVEWSASNGVLSTAPSPGATGRLTAALSVPVFFTPAGGGPWRVTARISAAVADPLANTFIWTDSSGTSHCARESALFINIDRPFYVQQPDCAFVEASTTVPVSEATPGQLVQFLVSNLSAYAGGAAPAELTLETQYWNDRVPNAVVGSPAPFTQRLPVAPDRPDTLRSSPLLWIAGDPVLTTAAAHRHALLPGILAVARLDNLLTALPTFSRKPLRHFLHGAPAALETGVRTTPFDGYESSANLATGEVLNWATDLTFQTRGGLFAFSRVYRSFAKFDGPLGAGWWSNQGGMVDVSHPSLHAWYDADASIHPVPSFLPQKGLFHTYHLHPDIGPDHGAFYFLSPRRDETHFNTDGSLRLLKDRRGNITRFRYNEKGQQIEIVDPMGRSVQLEYYTKNDPVPGEVVGKLKRITDFDQRSVDYDYYGTGDPNGQPGWLKTVTRPAAPTLVGGQEDPNYRRSMTYRYNAAGGQVLLREIVHNAGTTAEVEMLYQQDGRLDRQRYVGAEFVLTYPTPKRTEVTDVDGNKRTLDFPVTPFPAATTPVRLLEQANRNVRPGQGDLTTTFEHNADGNRTLVVLPDGVQVDYVYETAATSRRRHNNLLLRRQSAPAGESRVTTWTYSQRYNQVLSCIPPAGNRPGGIPRLYETSYTYDHQTGAGDKGNLVRVARPRTLNAVMIKNAAGNDELRWIHENPTTRIDYNLHGLPIRIEDEQGVVTALGYHPENAPGGSAASAPAAVNGGFLGSLVRDAAMTPARDLHFPGEPLAPRSAQFKHDKRGDLVECTDVRGVTHKLSHNALRQMTKAEFGTNFPATVFGATAKMEEHLKYDASGLVLNHEVLQPGASALAGGSVASAIATRDTRGQVVSIESDAGNNQRNKLGLGYTKSGLLEKLEFPGAKAGTNSAELISLVKDERTLPVSIIEAPGSSSPRTVSIDVNPRAEVLSIGSSGGPTSTVLRSPLGEVRGVNTDYGSQISGPVGADGHVLRLALAGPGSATSPAVHHGFVEVRVDEGNRDRRVHVGVVSGDVLPTPGSGFAIPLPIEGSSVRPGVLWPPIPQSSIADHGSWGAGDGRTTLDVVLDTYGQTTRVVTDNNSRLLVRRNTWGEVVSASDGRGLQLRNDMSPEGDVRGMSLIQQSFDPLNPQSLTLTPRIDHDAHGEPSRFIDTLGNAHQVTFDPHRRMLTFTDAMGPASSEVHNNRAINQRGNATILMCDADNRVRRIEMALKADGTTGSGPEQNSFNGNARLRMDFEGDASGRITKATDDTGNDYIWHYDSRGRLDRMETPASVAAPGGAARRLDYDPQGRVQRYTDPLGNVVRLDYDGSNRVVLMECEHRAAGTIGARGYSLGYNDQNRLRFAGEWTPGPMPPGLSEIEFRYDGEGNILVDLQGTNSGGRVAVECEYQSGHLRRSVRYPSSGPRLVAFYEESARIRRLDLNNASIASYNYQGGLALTTRRVGPVTQKMLYDAAGRLERIETLGLSGGTLVWTMGLDRNGRFTSQTRTQGAIVESRVWRRDSASRIVEETTSLPPGRGLDRIKIRRFFDAESVLRQSDIEETSAAGTTNRTVLRSREESGRVVRVHNQTLRYDASGQLLDDGFFRYHYDFLGRLARTEEIATQITVDYAYDFLGRLHRTTQGGTEDQYLYDGWNLIEVRRGTTVRERYYYGNAQDEPAAIEVGADRYFPLLRPDGSVDALVDAQGVIVESYDYTIDGERIVLDGQRRPKPGPALQRLGFHGKTHDQHTGLISFRYRLFSPRLGIFLTPDPRGVVPTGNAYMFANHDPQTFTDPWGLDNTGVDWWEAGWSFAKTVGVGLVLVAGAGLAVGAGIVSAPVVIAGGVALLAAGAVYNGVRRYQSGQSGLSSTVGGVLDVTGVSGVAQGGFEFDPATWSHLELSSAERGERLGSGAGMLFTFIVGGRAFRFGHARGVRIREARELQMWVNGEAPLIIRARSGEGMNSTTTRDTHLGPEIIEMPGTNVPGRPRGLEDAVDALVLRLRSMEGPDVPFREAALARYNTLDAVGNPRGSSFLLLTRPRAGGTDAIPPEEMAPLFNWLSSSQLARYPHLRLTAHGHSHPPGRVGSAPGHSGVEQYLYGMGRWRELDVSQDMAFLELALFRTPWATRQAPGLRPFVIRMGENGAIEEFAFIELDPAMPRPTDRDFMAAPDLIQRAMQLLQPRQR